VTRPTRIPPIDAAPLFAGPSTARERADAAIAAAARDSGFLVLTRLPDAVPLGPEARATLLRVLQLPEEARRALWRQAWAPEHPNVYRGYFPLHAGIIKEGMDIGPDRPPPPGHEHDALAEPTPLPPESALPGWRARVRTSFAALERVGAGLMHALARGLGLPETAFDAPFVDGHSTLRLILYPAWPALAERYGLDLRPVSGPGGARGYDIGGEHVDSGFVTLLQQDEVPGLQARLADGAWVDVPVIERALVVNFGRLLERWTGGRIRATEHRVLGQDRPRRSIPFFYEPRVDARIEPLPGGEPFEPFAYGDHLWDAMSRFAEFADAERWPRGAGPAGQGA
jgi:isopenicillin N synthase-like dioxygenase